MLKKIKIAIVGILLTGCVLGLTWSVSTLLFYGIDTNKAISKLYLSDLRSVDGIPNSYYNGDVVYIVSSDYKKLSINLLTGGDCIKVYDSAHGWRENIDKRIVRHVKGNLRGIRAEKVVKYPDSYTEKDIKEEKLLKDYASELSR